MASERLRMIQVGVLFIFSILVLIAGVLWFKEFQFGQKRSVVIAEFPSTSGLIKGDNVEVSGVPSSRRCVLVANTPTVPSPPPTSRATRSRP